MFGNDLTNGEINRSDFAPKQVLLKRLFVPILCRLVLLVAGIAVIVLSGETNVSQGSGTMYNHVLVPVTTSPANEGDDTVFIKDLCCQNLEKMRHVASSGKKLVTCVMISSEGRGLFVTGNVDNESFSEISIPLEVFNHICDQLAIAFNVPVKDQIRRFDNWRSVSRGKYWYESAHIRVEREDVDK